MIELAAALVASLFGVLLDRFDRWSDRQKRHQAAIRQDRAEQKRAIENARARIEREIANETDLSALVDRL
ncbi:MAG: hypothetical protein ACFB01_13700 [Cohaesibacteraceae bacterium]